MKVLFLILAFSLVGFGQKVATKPAEVSKRKVVIEKLDGDRLTAIFVSADDSSISVLLLGSPFKIGLDQIKSLQFGEQPIAEVKPTKKENSIDFESALVFRSGEAVPLARTDIALLDESAVELMKQSGVRSQDGKTDDRSIIFGFILNSISGTAEVRNAAALIQQHIKYRVQTDFAGKANLTDITPGRYFVFSFSDIRKSKVFWNVPVDVSEDGKIKIVLDQGNASFVM